MIGGRVTIDSSPAGTTVRLELRQLARTGTEGD